MSSSYFDKLKDPRWQKKRLEILERDKFACRECGNAQRELQVHHRFYLPRANPWDYPRDALVTLCCECHEARTENDREIARLLGVISNDGIVELICFLSTCEAEKQILPSFSNAEVGLRTALGYMQDTPGNWITPAEALKRSRINNQRMTEIETVIYHAVEAALEKEKKNQKEKEEDKKIPKTEAEGP